MTTFSRTSPGSRLATPGALSPLGRLLTVRRRRFDLAGAELPVTRLAIFFSVFPALRPSDLFVTWSDLIFGLSAVLLLLSGRMRFAPMGPITVPWLGAFALFSGAMIVSSLIGDAPERVLIVLAQYGFAYVLLAYILVRSDEPIVDSFVKAFVLGTVFVNAYGLAVYFTGADKSFQFVTGSGRLASFMDNPNANANVIGLTLPFVLYLWLSRKWPRAYVLGSIAILSYALVATSSVGGLLWSLAGLAVFILLMMSRRMLIGIAVCAAVLVPLFAEYGESVLPEAFQQRVLGAAESGHMSEAGTFSYRMRLIREALGLVDEQMLVGLGADQYRAQSFSGLPVHNVYLLLWAEGGLPALIGWLLLPQIIALTALWVFGRPGGRLIAATVLAVVVVFLLAATGTAHMYARFWVVPLLLATSLLMVSWANGQRPLPGPPAAKRRSGPAIPPPTQGSPSRTPLRTAGVGVSGRPTSERPNEPRGDRSWPRNT